MLFKSKVKDAFGVESIVSNVMERTIRRCEEIYTGHPDWVDQDDHIRTINFAKSICSEVARLTTLGIGIKLDGSTRANWLQEVIDKEYFNIREWCEYANAYGTVVLKPNDKSIDLYLPDRYVVTAQEDGEISGIIFISQKKVDEKYYTRLEYHRFIDSGEYAISNRCYVGDTITAIGEYVPIEKTPWPYMYEEAIAEKVDRPLYGVLKTPHANNIDIGSPMKLPIFAEAIEELKELDIAYSRIAKEIFDSKRILLLDSDRMMPSGGKVEDLTRAQNEARKAMGLPDIVKNVFGDGVNSFYEEINPSINTDARLSGINSLLSQIGYKIGFSNGYFVFNESSGIQTATGVEAEQQRTIQFIKDVRDKLENCLDGVIYALNVFADLYDLSPAGSYEVVYDFGDITYNCEEDRARWYSYANSGKIPFSYYLVKFEGFTEEEAKALVEEAQPKKPALFDYGE